MAKPKPTPSANISAVLGSDESTVKAVARELAEKLTPPDAGEFGAEIIDGAADNANAAATRIHDTIAALQTLPFFGGKLVWLKNTNALADTPIGRSNGVLEALESLLALLSKGLPADVRFLLSATETDKRRTFYKGLTKLADTQIFDKLDSSRAGWEEEAAVLVEERARARALEFTGEASELFTLMTGGDTRQIENELEKLDLYLGPDRRDVDAPLVRTLVPMSRAGVIFELGNAISRRDLDAALGLIDQLLYQGRERHRSVARGGRAHRAQPPARARPPGTLPAGAGRVAVRVWQGARAPARGSHRASAAQKGRHRQHVRPGVRGGGGASF